jgi:hypothetical protein
LPSAAAAHQPRSGRPVARMAEAAINHGRRQTGNCSMRVTIQSGSSRRTAAKPAASISMTCQDIR